MKKIIWSLIIVFLSVTLLFQYKKYKRYNPPAYFNYVVKDSIDVNYYNPIAVQQYFENAYQIGSFARQLWFNKGIDINFLDESKHESIPAKKYYKTLLATTHILEQKLIKSYKLKQQGYTNNEIKRIMEEGIPSDKIGHQQAINAMLFINKLKIGDVGQNTWALQKLLITKGYDIPKDGSFGIETHNAIINFQRKNDLYPNGIINIATIKELVK